MIEAIKTVLTKLTGLFIVTQPKLKIEPIPGTEDGYGGVYRLTERSGEHRDVFVFFRWEFDEKTGKRTAVTDFTSRSTGYTNVVAVDYEHRGMRGRPTVIRGKATRKKLSREDHDALIEFLEEQDKNRKDADFDTRYVRLYPPIPKDKAPSPNGKALELKL